MIEWLPAAPALLVALALATVPGLPIAWALRFRGLTFVAASIAASFTVIALTSLLTPLLGVGWGVLPVLAVSLLLTAALLPVRRFAPPSIDSPGHTRLSVLVTGGAILVATALIGTEVMNAIGRPSNISQTFDAVFHLNAAAQILATGDASPLHMNLASPAQEIYFYPTVWHALVALVAQLSSASIPVATNAVALIVSAWVWPVGMLFFSRPFFVRRPAHLLMGAVLTAIFSAFPYLMLAWGVLYPNLLSTALIPFALGFLYLALRSRTVGAGVPTLSLWIAAGGAIGAATLAHPNALFGIAVFTLPIFVVVARDVWSSSRSTPDKIWRWAALGAAVACYGLLWKLLTTGEARSYDEHGPLSAFIDAVTNAPLLNTRAYFTTMLVLGGIIVLMITKHHRWLIGSYLLAIALYAVAVGFTGPIRDFITGPWYSDAARIASLLPIAAIPLAGAAAAMLLDLVIDGLRAYDPDRVSEFARPLLPYIGVAIVFGLVATGGRGSAIPMQSGWIADLHVTSDERLLLTDDEIELLERIADEVPEGALIAGDPWSGAGLAYAWSGRPVLFPHLQGSFGDEASLLAAEFRNMDPAEACSLLDELGVDYMLDFGEARYDVGNRELASPYDGLRYLSGSPVLEPVDEEGRAVLYRVSC